MLNDLFGKNFKLAWLLIVIAEALSFWSHQITWLNHLIFLVILLAVLILSLKNLAWGFYVLLAELFIGSKGYLFFLTVGNFRISIRIGIFLVIMAVWFYQLLRYKDKVNQFFTKANQFFYYYLTLALFLLIGAVNGLAHQSIGNVFFDFNGWLYFLLTPVFFAVFSQKEIIGKALSILFAAVSYLSLKTLVLLVIFSRQLAWPLETIYRWVRDSGVGEITWAGVNFYRIFFQAHLYVLIGFLLSISLLLFAKRLAFARFEKRWLFLTMILSSTAVLASLSRSFWLGGLAALAIALAIYFWQARPGLLKLGLILLALIVLFFLENNFLKLISGSFENNLIAKRFAAPTEEAAASSRISQLKPLWRSVQNNLLLGSGFGQTVTYQSDDPRIRKASPDGWYATYAFEWGYLDIWLKIGLFGLLAYLALLLQTAYQAWLLFKQSDFLPLILGLILGLAGAVVTSIFSPYLNHPLGIGWLMLVSAVIFSLNVYEKQKN